MTVALGIHRYNDILDEISTSCCLFLQPRYIVLGVDKYTRYAYPFRLEDAMAEPEELEQTVRRQYSSDADVARYHERAMKGFSKWEREIVQAHMNPTRVLNVGCGGGREAFALESLGYETVGIDIINEQVVSAKRTAKEIVSQAKFRLYDGNRFPFDPREFGAVTFWSQVLGNVPTSVLRHSLLLESHRVLQPHGVLSLSVHELNSSLTRMKETKRYSYRILNDGEPGDFMICTESGPECYWHYFTRDEVSTLCTEAGFDHVTVQTTADLGESWDNVLVVVCFKS